MMGIFRTIRFVGTWAVMVLLGLSLVFIGGCVRQSTTTVIEPEPLAEAEAQAAEPERASTFWVKEAPLPEGWPELTPVGVVQVKDYPDTRAAVVRRDVDDSSSGETSRDAKPRAAERGNTSGGMFRSLFNHIKSRDIAMTSPVEMAYDDNDTSRMSAMAFLYRHPEQGVTETNGRVSVEDFPERSYASIGLRGGYDDGRFTDALDALDDWLDTHADTWQADGPPRYLGYNSPFVPGFMKYGEVQRPVRPVE